jgi:hypothetical protein
MRVPQLALINGYRLLERLSVKRSSVTRPLSRTRQLTFGESAAKLCCASSLESSTSPAEASEGAHAALTKTVSDLSKTTFDPNQASTVNKFDPGESRGRAREH